MPLADLKRRAAMERNWQLAIGNWKLKNVAYE
jgi:hypothetical protein